jgi:hypothetical protein
MTRIERGLAVGLLSIAIVQLGLIANARTPSSIATSVAVGSDATSADSAGAPSSAPDLRHYQSAIGRRDLFRLPRPAARKAPPAAVQVPISGLAANLELIGVVGGKEPQALLRDRKTGSVYYILAGQKIGELTVDEIRSRSVLLTRGDEQIEVGL